MSSERRQRHMKESKADRFRRVAEARVNKIIKVIRLLGNCSGTSVYAYTDAQVAYIFSALQSELDKGGSESHRSENIVFHWQIQTSLTMIALWSQQLHLSFRTEATFGPLSMRMTTFLPSISIGITMVEKLPSCSALQNTIPNGMKVRRSASAPMPQTRMKPNITRHIWQKGIMNHEFKSNKTNLGGGCGNGPDRTPKNHWQRCFLYGKIR